MKLILLFLFSHPLLAQLTAARNPYYTLEFYNSGLGDRSPHNTEGKLQAIRIIQDIMRLSHQSHQYKYDTLTNHCNGAENCRRHNTLSYSGEARGLVMGILSQVNYPNERSLEVQTVYCNRRYTLDVRDDGRYSIPNHQDYNVEHTMPQSMFNSRHSKGKQKSDLHNLYPTVNKVNSTRGHYAFGEIPGDTHGIRGCPTSEFLKRGEASIFEPPKEHRGNVARSLAYFMINYDIMLSQTEIDFIIKWNMDDPVSDQEMRKNDLIHYYQGNRNPFVDFPHLVNLLK